MADEIHELEALHLLQKEIGRLTARVHELEAVQAVRDTLLDYTLYHDRGWSRELAELFTEDATLDIAGFGVGLDTSISGRAAIREMYAQIDARSDGPPPYKHGITNLRIGVSEDEATASSYLLDWGGEATDQGPGGGMYRDRLVRQPDGRWLIKHKRIVSTAGLTVDAVLADDV